MKYAGFFWVWFYFRNRLMPGPKGFQPHRTARRHCNHRDLAAMRLPATRSSQVARGHVALNTLKQTGFANAMYRGDNNDELSERLARTPE